MNTTRFPARALVLGLTYCLASAVLAAPPVPTSLECIDAIGVASRQVSGYRDGTVPLADALDSCDTAIGLCAAFAADGTAKVRTRPGVAYPQCALGMILNMVAIESLAELESYLRGDLKGALDAIQTKIALLTAGKEVTRIYLDAVDRELRR